MIHTAAEGTGHNLGTALLIPQPDFGILLKSRVHTSQSRFHSETIMSCAGSLSSVIPSGEGQGSPQWGESMSNTNHTLPEVNLLVHCRDLPTRPHTGHNQRSYSEQDSPLDEKDLVRSWADSRVTFAPFP